MISGLHIASAPFRMGNPSPGDLIINECTKASEKTGVFKAALTGGVFQNKILMELALAGLRKNGIMPYYNISVSPNDGGIVLGQIYVAMQHKYNTGI